ncbi:hypothetical protein MKW94_003417 [Papaver nudicaule]|uniref:Wax synthase domain-containing protein n=1 Tax=Papaver nudicaule TaxID=74823 RepID=A0AA41S0N4_PAPNU|nr:hypothetical protein [Papaver nudicaule]
MEEIKRWIKVWVIAFIALTYCYFIPSRIPKGKLRLVSVIPVVYLFIILPWNLHSNLLGGPTAFSLVWLGNFNLLLFSFGKGPLSPPPKHGSISLFTFLALAFLPIKIKQQTNNNNSPSSGILKPPSALHFATEVLVLAILSTKQNIHPKLVTLCYCGYLYIGLQFILLAVGVVAAKVLHLEIEPPFNDPYLSTSLQDFWARRWNLLMTNILRLTVYEPLKKWGHLKAQFAAFVVSGLMHEIIFFYLGGRVNPPTWEITCFFVLQGFCVCLEVKVKKLVKGSRWSLPPMVSTPLTVGFLTVTSSWLLFPPLIRGGFDVKSRREIVAVIDYVKDISKQMGVQSY